MTDVNEHIIEISKQIGRIGEIVRRHDETTFPQIQDELKNQSKMLIKIDSKHNQDYLQYIAAKQELEKRISPLEEDFKARQELKADTKNRLWDWVWEFLKAGVILFITWLGVKMGVIKSS